MLKRYKVTIVIIFIILMYIVIDPGNISVPAEKVSISSGISFDLKIDDKGDKHYEVASSFYTFNKKDQVNFLTVSGIGRNTPITRELRQTKINHKFLFGMEKVILYSEDTAKNGLEAPIDALFSNQYISDMGWMVICKGKAMDILKLKIGDFPTSSDFIQGMIETSKEGNFFSDNYKVIDTFVRVDAEGRTLVLPYIEYKDNVLQITGIALFKKDKMVTTLNLEETKIMNFLRENNVKGMLILQKGFNNLTVLNGIVKRKVLCKKINDNKYKFDINLEYTGDEINNTIYHNFLTDPKEVHKFEQLLAQNTEKDCYKFINKMQKEYKVDCLELGRVAAAKYGRGTGVSWDDIISNSEIKVNVKVKVESFGRGEYHTDKK